MRSSKQKSLPLDRLTALLCDGKLGIEVATGYRYTSPHPQGQHGWIAPHFGLQFGHQGAARYRFGEKRLLCRPGELLLVSPGVAHDYRIDKGVSAYFLAFRLLENGAPVACAEPFLHVAQALGLLPILRSILSENRRQNPWQASRLRAQFSLLFTGMLLARTARHPGKRTLTEGQSETIFLYLSRNASRPIRASELASALHLSREYFCKLFLNTHGVTPRVFIMREKLRQASVMLQQEDVSVAEVARRMGYASVPTFCRQYQRLFGAAPGVHRGT
ncbi:MAG: AraC family transcriptional regulator [Spirochaetes bacterium]|nr:AraC family transcriptional regulator [Spirochaetota bacterium]